MRVRLLGQRILDDAGTDPGALALLAFALHELYEARTPQGQLRHAAYDAFGGVRGAISRRAETTFARLPPAAQSEPAATVGNISLADIQAAQGLLVRLGAGQLRGLIDLLSR